MNKIMECVPNFSEGRDLQKIDKIVAPFRGKQGVKLLDYSNDEDHNRLVVTVVGEPEPLRDAVKWARRLQNVTIFPSSYMKSLLLPLIGRIWLLSVKGSSKVWPRR